MKKRKLRNLEVNPIGMGCMGFSHGYGEIPTEEYSIQAIQKAYDFGCDFYDTAEAYAPRLSSIGHNELIVGKALKPFRKHVVLATKLHLNTAEVSESGLYPTLEKHLKSSMLRLQTDYIDLYYLHRLNPDIPVEEVAEAMGKLEKEGLIRGWGLSQVGIDTIQKAQAVHPLSAIQNIYSMVERSCEDEVIPYCIENNIALVPFSPIASGLLSGKVNTNTDFSHDDDVRKFVPQLKKENLEANRPLIELIGKYAEMKHATDAQIALAWMLHKYPNIIPIPGSKNQERILENLGAWNVELTNKEFQHLDDTLNTLHIQGFRGHVEQQGGTMADWGKRK